MFFSFLAIKAIKMSLPPKNLSLFGDIAHRDVFQRQKNQVVKQGDIQNYYVHVNEANVPVDTLIERVSVDGAGSRYEIYTKPSIGNVVVAANASMLELTTGKTAIRSLLFEATGNAAVGGAMGIAGGTTLSTLATSGPATLNSAMVTGQTFLGNTNIALGDNGALNVSGNGNVNFDRNSLSCAGIISLTGPTTVGPYIGPWISRTSAFNHNWREVTYGNGLFVAVSSSGTGNKVMTSPNGITWTSRNSASDNTWWAVTYGNGLFVAVAQSGTGNRVMTSPDGINWTSRTSASDNDWWDVAYGNGLFVAVAASGTGNRVMTSPDGITWTSRTNAVDNQWYSVVYGNGLFVAVAISGTGNRVMTSPDGITWTSRTSSADNQWYEVVYGNGLFVAVAISGNNNRVMTSPDGITWTSRTSAANNNWRSVAYGSGLFVAVAFSGIGNRVMTSNDGITWTLRSNPVNNEWWGVTYGNGLFVAVAGTGTGDRVMTANAGLPNLATRTSFAGNLEMRNNNVVNVTSMTRDNVRVFFQNNIQAQTWSSVENAWSTTTTTTQHAFVANKALHVTGDSTLSGNLAGNGMTVGSSILPKSLTVFGNLDVKGTATTTRIESTTVQMREMNLELGFLQVNLGSLNGGGITVGGAGGIMEKRPTFAYNSALDAWQPNIDIVTTSGGATDVAKIALGGSIGSTLQSNANVFTKMDSSSLNFGDSWRFRMNVTGNDDVVQLEQLENGAWNPKFTFTK